MTQIIISFFSYLLDKLFGEYSFIKHPIIIIGELIKWYEKHFYKDSIKSGLFLVFFVLAITMSVSISIEIFLKYFNDALYIVINSFLASMFLAHRMLYDVVKDILSTEDKKQALSMLVSRDTKELSESDIYKGAIETYAENLSDGVIAPLFYLLAFGLFGIVAYKAINTMDSMVGYRNKRYENFGKAAALLDDIVNFIPSRLTALLIAFLTKQKQILLFLHYGVKHKSPNAGHPISSMALYLGVSLGGDMSYFGKLQKKPYFGNGRKFLQKEDLENALVLRTKIDKFILIMLFFMGVVFYGY